MHIVTTYGFSKTEKLDPYIIWLCFDKTNLKYISARISALAEKFQKFLKLERDEGGSPGLYEYDIVLNLVPRTFQ